jgi:hypothetical protein
MTLYPSIGFVAIDVAPLRTEMPNVWRAGIGLQTPLQNPLQNPFQNPFQNPLRNPIQNPLQNPLRNPFPHQH